MSTDVVAGVAGRVQFAATPRTLDDLLAVEDDPAIPDIVCPRTGVPLWPLVRSQFLRAMMSDLFYGAPLHGGAPALGGRAAAASLARAAAHNATHRLLRADVLIMGTGVGNQLVDGRWYNRLSDPLALALPTRSLVVEDLYQWRWPFPRHNDRVLFHAPIQAGAAVVGRTLARDEHLLRARRLLELVSERAQRLLAWAPGLSRLDGWVKTLAHKAAAMPWLEQQYTSLLTRIRPKVLLKEEACYGPAAVLLATARKLGIATAEYQHGVVSAGHDAYNLAPALSSSSAYRRTLPDFFLGYGRWWNEQIQVPVEKRAIGNPHRTAQLRRYAPVVGPPSTVIVLGDGIETDLYVAFARRLATRLANRLAVVFRPHPLEREAVRLRFANGIDVGVTLDPNDDIYRSFASAQAVVSELSTGLFEAVGLVRNIVVWDTPKSRFALRTHPFPTFVEVDDLVDRLLADDGRGLSSEQERAIWEPSWSENYMHFLADIGVQGAS